MGDDLGAASLFFRAWRARGEAQNDPLWLKHAKNHIKETCYSDQRLLPIAQNGLRNLFLESSEAAEIRHSFRNHPVSERVRLRDPRPEDDPERQGDLIVLKKHDPTTGELGVLLITFTEQIRRFAVLFDLVKIASRYTVVLEPSSWGYQDLTFGLFLGRDFEVVVESPRLADFRFIGLLQSNLIPTRLGAGDWIDPELFSESKRPLAKRSYDLVMVSAWHPLKRHRDLLEALAALRRQGKSLKFALIGNPSAWSQSDIENMVAAYGLADQCTIFQSIPQRQVADILGDSRGYVLLSRREGANRALYEALFCNTPVLVYRNHYGVNIDHINEFTGLFFDEGALDKAILELLGYSERFAPRVWAEKNTGYPVATRQLNEELKELARANGRPWKHDIVEHTMAPTPRYAEPDRYRDFADEYDRLSECLLL